MNFNLECIPPNGILRYKQFIIIFLQTDKNQPYNMFTYRVYLKRRDFPVRQGGIFDEEATAGRQFREEYPELPIPI